MMNRRTITFLWLMLGLLAVVPLAVQAVDDIPSCKTVFFNTWYPKAGQTGLDIPAGDVRTAAGTLYEGWWREESYWRSNPTNGIGIRGFNMKTKVYGDMPMPWFHGILSNMTSPAASVPLAKGHGIDFSGEKFNEAKQRYGRTGPLIDGTWTPGERFQDTQRYPGVPPNQSNDWVVLDEDYWNSDNTVNGLIQGALSDPAFELAGRINLYPLTATYKKGQDRWDSRRGEYYADYMNETIIDVNTTFVKTVSFCTNAVIWVANTAGGFNVPFTVSDFTVYPPWFDTSGNQLPGIPNEGDFNHTIVVGVDNTQVSVPKNGMFDYNVDDVNATPLVYPATFNGLKGVNGDAWISYYSYLYVDPNAGLSASTYLSGPGVDQYYQYPNAGKGAVPCAAKYAYQIAAHFPAVGVRLCKVWVRVYQAGELWGEFLQGPIPSGTSGFVNEYIDYQYPDYPSPDYPADDVWTPGKDHEPYEDFLSWWRPDWNGGTWVDALVGVPFSVTNGLSSWETHPGPTSPDKHLGKPTSLNAITYADYTAYISNNYPGNVNGLIARAANGLYDGPDDWTPVLATTNKMQRAGYLLAPVTPEPGDWDPDRVNGGTYAGWWLVNYSQYGSAVAPAWNPLIGNVSTFVATPVDAYTNLITGTATTVVAGVTSTYTTYGSQWYPAIGSTWGYQGAREYDDLPSSMYHNHGFSPGSGTAGGDMRLGEVTDPQTWSVYGADKGPDNPWAPGVGGGDGIIPACGPLAYNVNGVNGYDAGNEMNIEIASWRTDGTYFTGPRISTVGSTNSVPTYQRDHRDVTLDGLLDLGATVPEMCYNYSVDITGKNSGGRKTNYPFNWQRYFEDCVAAWDDVEDFNALEHNNSTGTAETQIQAPSSFTWTPGTRMTSYLPHVYYHQNNGIISHVGFDPAVDDMWISTLANGIYNAAIDTNIINNALQNGEVGISISPVAWLDMPNWNGTTYTPPDGHFTPIQVATNGDDVFTWGDVVWYDANGNGAYDLSGGYEIPIYSEGWASAGIGTNALTGGGGGESGGAGGNLSIGPHVAGYGYSCATRDHVYMGGLAHVWPQNLTFGGATHEQGHELVGWGDYYDYNVWGGGGVIHTPVGRYDLMANGGLVHGIAQTKELAGWAVDQVLNNVNTTQPPILRAPNSGVQTVLMYPVERVPDQYYSFYNPNMPDESFSFWYVSGQSPYSVYPGQQGIMIQHADGGNLNGHPDQQRVNYRFFASVVQADGQYAMEDGINPGDTGDLWGPAHKVFNEYSIPPSRWWDQSESGIRIKDIRLPANPLDPAQVDFEWVSTTNTWYWVGPSGGIDPLAASGSTNGVSGSGGSGSTNGVSGSGASGSATGAVVVTSLAPGVGQGASGGYFGVLAGGNRDDTNGNGIPDEWEIYWFGRYANPLAICTAASDWDGDGLPDYAEWLAHLNPMDQWSWSNDIDKTVTDAEDDLDGDGISNLDEYRLGLNMREPDSDDDGWSDGQELDPTILKPDQTGPFGVRRITSPLYSRSPLIERCLHLTASDSLTIPSIENNDPTRFQTTNWTVEAWVKLDTSNETGSIVARTNAQGVVATFGIGVANNVPYARFSTDGGQKYYIAPSNNVAFASNTWHHVAGVYSTNTASLSIYVDGYLAATEIAPQPPTVGTPSMLGGSFFTGGTALGGGFNGCVDEVRIWASGRTAAQILKEYDKIVNSPWIPGYIVINGVSQVVTSIVQSVANDGTLISNLRFDDGQNTNIVDEIDGTVHKGGIEDWVHPLGPNEGVYWNGGDRVTTHGYCVMLKGNAALVSDPAQVVHMKFSDVRSSPIDDLDEDGIADWWQALYWPTYNPEQSGPWSAQADPDQDGLPNLAEYLLDLNPLDPDTDNTGITDGDKDSDGDGLSNRQELQYGTDPLLWDTDDDGISDGDEVKFGTNPLDASSPLMHRSLAVNGQATCYVQAPTGAPELALTNFDVSAWVYPTNALATNAQIVAREVSPGVFNYWLGIDTNGVPFITFTTADLPHSNITVSAPVFMTVPGAAWTYLRATFNASAHRLSLSMADNDGGATVEVAFLMTVKLPATYGLQPMTRMGAGFAGLIDDVLINGDAGTVLSYEFDDGTSVPGTSGNPAWKTGQVQNYIYTNDWKTQWAHAGTLKGGAAFYDYDRNVGSANVITYSTLDSDGDGLPDWWEIKYGLDPYNADTGNTGVPDGQKDLDRDGVSNLYEYMAGLDPTKVETRPGTPDGLTTCAGGLSLFEKQQYKLDPLVADTDDDGVSDYDEVHGTSAQYPGWYTLANASLSPAKSGALQISGANQYVEMPHQSRIQLDDAWTVEAWVNISNSFGAAGNATIVRRQVDTTVNYELGLAGGAPYVKFVGVYNGNVTNYAFVAASPTVLARRNQWYHLAGVYDKAAGELRIVVDGRVAKITTVRAHPDISGGASTNVQARVGENFRGLIDEVRIWNTALSVTDLAVNAYQTFENVANGPVLYYRFDDGPFGVTTTYTNLAYAGRGIVALHTVEDFSQPPADWLTGWANAGTLVGAVMAQATTPIPAMLFVDQDADDLPDFWEIAAFGSIATYSGKDDPDGDGLNNFYEYRAHLNPLAPSTFFDNISDYDRDSDGDGISNGREQQLGTLPDMKDTDDDGLTDGAEVTGIDANGNHVGISDPLNSLSPMINRSLSVNGNARVVVPAQGRHAMNQQFTLAAWVWPSNNIAVGTDAIVVARTLDDNNNSTVNYELGISNDGGTLRPYIRYTGITNRDIRVEANLPGVTSLNANNAFDAVPAQAWTHIAGSYQAASNTLKLFVGGELVAWRSDAAELPMTGAGANLPLGAELTIGGGRLATDGTTVSKGFKGYIDDVRIAAYGYSGEAIRQMAGGQMVIVSNAVATNAASAADLARVGAANPVPAYKPSELIVGLRAGNNLTTMAAALGQSGMTVIKSYSIIPAMHVRITDGTDLSAKITALKADGRIAYVEPNYALRLFDTIPNDPMFGEQWGLNNTGMNGPGGGVAGADIHAPKAWDVSTGKPSVIVAVIDTGIDYTHPDLKNNMWHNPGEIPNNGIDDDGNGYIDDYYGYDFADNRPDPIDDVVGHGTHCAGIIGASGNNGAGVSGVNWNVQLMALKIADDAGNLSLAAAIEAIQYAWKMGARVSNNSWGGYMYSQALYDAIKKAGDNDHLFCAAAANDSVDNDLLPAYPASYDLDNIIAVAATDNSDALASFSNYGVKTVDLGAPGVSILSTLPLNGSMMGPGPYGFLDGTSMATPHVVGAAALVLSVDKYMTCAAVKAAILNNVDPDPALVGKTVTGGRLNVGNILPQLGGGAAGSVVVNGLAGWFRFDDGGATAEDFTLTKDWMRDWRYAGQLSSGSAMTTNNPHFGTGDSDGDGLPDWWEVANGLDPYDPTGVNGADGDPDGDGLSNLYEYLAGTDPHNPDTGNTGISDYDKDSDGDGISNGIEQDVYHTNPGSWDSDDDGISDGQEAANGTKPSDSTSPYRLMVLEFKGTNADPNANIVRFSDKVDEHYTLRDSMAEWTIEAYVQPYTTPNNGVSYALVSRRTIAFNARNYELGINNGVPYIGFDPDNGQGPAQPIPPTVACYAASGQVLPTNSWTHLAGRLTLGKNGADNELALFINGVKVSTTHTRLQPAVGPGDLIFGSPGFAGMLSNVRLWKIPQDDQSIAGMLNNTLIYGNVDSMAGRLHLPTGTTGHLKETATTVQPDGDYIDMLRQNWTLECWVKTTATGGSLIERRNQAAQTPDNFNYYLGISPQGTLLGRFAIDYSYLVAGAPPTIVYVRNFVLNNMTGEIPVNDGKWHHVAYIRSDNGCYLYVDNLLDASQSRLMVDPQIPAASYVQFPAVFAQPGPCIFGETLAGDMDEIRIWNRALSSAELSDVGGRNLSGTENGLISYFNFDFQLGITADERSVLRDPTTEYGIYIPDATRLVGSAGGAPITYNPLLAVQRIALIGMFPCNDGGLTVENFLYRMGIASFNGVQTFNNGAYAGQRVSTNDVVFKDLSGMPGNYPFNVDSDGDGLPDWWEIAHGLDPSDPSGINGPYGDPDHDGLDNEAEYRAGTDPRNPNSPVGDGWARGFFDYDHRSNSNSLTYGELFTGMDSLPALWKFENGLNPDLYVAGDDPDGDGWDNYAEYMAGTSPLDSASIPRPIIAFNVWYNGAKGVGDLKVETYTTSAMDGTPDARITHTVAATDVYPLAFKFSGTNNITGNILEGDNWFFAYVDLNGNNTWDPGEPAGIAVYQPLRIGWGALNVDLQLIDTPQGFPRVSWPLPAGVQQSRVSLDYAIQHSGATNTWTWGSQVDVTLQAPRNYLDEADIIRLVGTANGTSIGTNGLFVPVGDYQPLYRYAVQYDPPGPVTPFQSFAPSIGYSVFTQLWTAAVNTKPVVLYPYNETVQTMPVRLEWKSTDRTAAFQVEIAQGTTTGAVVFSSIVRAPYYRDNGGQIHYVFYPQLWQTSFLQLPDGAYYWHVKTSNNGTSIVSAYSDWSRMLINTSGVQSPPYGNPPSVTGPYSIAGNLDYMGKVQNLAINEVVLTGTGAAKTFSNKPLTNKMVTAGTLTVSLHLNGGTNDLVTFSDTGANTTNLASVTLKVLAYQNGWAGSTCIVNYLTGNILSLSFTNTPSTNAMVLATYQYQGYPFIVQAYRALDVPGFSGKPVAQVSMWQKGPFTITGLPPDTYVLLGFIDQFGTGRLDSPETWGFVRNPVPESGPGYQEIHTFAVGPSVTTNNHVSLMLRDRDTDNDKLPDAWEIQKFGSISAYSGEQMVPATGKTVWQNYADGVVDSDPNLWDSNYDGLPDCIALLIGTNTHSYDSDGDGISDLEEYLSGSDPLSRMSAWHFTIPEVSLDAGGNPVIHWTSPAVPAMAVDPSGSMSGAAIVYTVLRSASLSGGTWTPIGEVRAVPGDANQTRIYVDSADPTRPAGGASYRIRAQIIQVNN